MKDQKLFNTLHDLFSVLALESDMDEIKRAIQTDIEYQTTELQIDWKELRNNFFNECTTETPKEEIGKKVSMAPHDLFEWFKNEISEYLLSNQADKQSSPYD